MGVSALEDGARLSEFVGNRANSEICEVVTFSLFLGLSISSCAVWVSAWLHQQQSKAASIFRMTSSLSTSGRRAQCGRIAATAMGRAW